MARAYGFMRVERDSAFFRQRGLCAHCGRSLRDAVEHAHHVIPNQSGVAAKGRLGDGGAFMRSVDNCVVLCDDCHDAAHAWNFRSGAVAPPSWFRYVYGRGALGSQRAWASRIEAEWGRMFPKANAKAK